MKPGPAYTSARYVLRWCHVIEHVLTLKTPDHQELALLQQRWRSPVRHVSITCGNQASRTLRRVVSGGGSLRRRVNTHSSDPGSMHNMDKAEHPKENKGNAISNQPGDGYATRSDEAGFGAGEFGGNAEDNIKLDQQFNKDHPGYDKSQGKEWNKKDKSGNK